MGRRQPEAKPRYEAKGLLGLYLRGLERIETTYTGFCRISALSPVSPFSLHSAVWVSFFSVRKPERPDAYLLFPNCS